MKNIITYLKGDATSPDAMGTKIITHVCNDIGGWGKGFVLAISKKWREPEQAYRKWHAEKPINDFELGAMQVVKAEPGLYVANMVAQKGIRITNGEIPLQYAALKKCLIKLAGIATEKQASVHMPRIGCGLAGGKWELVEPLIIEALTDRGIQVYVYDF